jgi:uncharacterized protein (TIGR03382 family)
VPGLATVVSIALGVLASASSPSSGDEKNPDVDACQGKQAGDPCQRGLVDKAAGSEATTRREPGVCATDRCCSLDYSKGSPPQSVCNACLVCKPGAPTSNGPPASADGRAADDDAAQVEPPRAGDGQQPPPATPNGRGCRTTDPPTPASALALLALVALRRRLG